MRAHSLNFFLWRFSSRTQVLSTYPLVVVPKIPGFSVSTGWMDTLVTQRRLNQWTVRVKERFGTSVSALGVKVSQQEPR